MHSPGGTVFGYPKGVFLLSFTELWERWSYYGMLSLLVLFLTANLGTHGFGWDEPAALKLYGFYTSIIFIIPLAGGWIANDYWGERRCILIGGILLIIGHSCLAGPKLIPLLARLMTGVDYAALWIDANIPMGSIFPGSAERAQLARAAAGVNVSAGSVILVYQLISASFFSGLLFIIAGTGLIKPTISSIIGRFYDKGDPRRDGAFSIFFTGIYIGALLSSFTAGFLGERVAWHLGFSTAAIGMAIGLVVYLWKQHEYVGDVGLSPAREVRSRFSLRNFSAEEIDRLKVILFQAIFTIMYGTAWYQTFGLLTLFAKDDLDRYVAGWEIPVTWFIVMSNTTFVLVTPFAAKLWQKLDKYNLNPGSSTKLGWGLIIVGIGYLILVLGMPADGNGKTWWIWMAITYICFGISDILVWPIQISLVSKLAPTNLSSLFVGGWYVSIGLGSLLAGYLGAIAYEWDISTFFLLLAAATIILGSIACLLTPVFRRLMHGIE